MLGNLLSKLTGGDATPTIAHEDFAMGVASKTLAIVDVREPHEYAAGHVPGAVNMPLGQFDPAALPKGKPVVLVCQAGGRSAKALTATMRAGLDGVRHYAPGTGGWRAAGGPVE